MKEDNKMERIAALYSALHKAKKSAAINGLNVAEREYVYISQGEKTGK